MKYQIKVPYMSFSATTCIIHTARMSCCAIYLVLVEQPTSAQHSNLAFSTSSLMPKTNRLSMTGTRRMQWRNRNQKVHRRDWPS